MKPHSAIGILGGTFDPIHLGHLKIAEHALKKVGFSKILFLPNQVPPHREQPLASTEQRVAMLNLAIANQAEFIIDNTELKRQGPSYMVDTLRTLKKQYPATSLNLIIGADAFFTFNTWHYYQQIFDYANIVVLNRPDGFGHCKSWLKNLLSHHQTKNAQDLLSTENGLIYIIHIAPIPISATTIREKLNHGKSIENDVPQAVYHYIKTHHLYQESE